MSLIQHVIGLNKDLAMEKLSEAGYKVRVVHVDGPPAQLTENHDVGRVTLEVIAGKVISAKVG